MKTRYINQFFLTLFALAICTSASAQDTGKAKVKIKKSENGEIEESYEEFDLTEGQDIEDILRQLDLLDEFGQLRDGQAFEIIIKKLEGDDELQNYDISFYPEGHEFKAFLGVMLKENHNDNEEVIEGALVTEVYEGTAAESSGLQAGDIIVGIEDEPINSVAELVEYIGMHEAGDQVSVKYKRDGKSKKTKAVLGERPVEDNVFYFHDLEDMPEIEGLDHFIFPEMAGPLNFKEGNVQMEERTFLGVSPACGLNEGEGIRLGTITQGSSAEQMGLLSGDRITAFNGKEINNFDELTGSIESVQPGEEVKIDIIRDTKKKKIKGEIGKRSYTRCNDMEVFHEYKGCDEGGNIMYNYDFNLDEEAMQESLERLVESLNIQEAQMQERAMKMEERSIQMAENNTIIEVRIDIESITEDDMNQVNSSASPRLSNEDDLAIENISFYPNPNNGQINLKFQLNEREPVDIILYDQNGSIVYKESVLNFSGSYTNTIDISDQADGSYFLQIMQGERTYSKKVIKNS
ncbi:MAG: membrane-associated protease RseP (regulator of RpoE activity) [Flavobacteriales bacterium]|jgi:membrane-associated protease RseP (regulator of RpoE activity)